MSTATSYTLAYGGAALLSLLLTPLCIRLARVWGVLDLPNARNETRAPTPRIGGLAIAFATLLAAGGVLLAAGFLTAGTGGYGESFRLQGRLLVAGGAALFVLAVGFLDDLLNVPSRYKLLALLAAATAVCAGGSRIDELILGNQVVLSFGYLSWPITVLWICGVTVSINFIDGLDGLAAGITAVACGVVAVAAAVSGQVAVAVAALALIGGLTGFLCFNFHPARIFMGDCGSMFIGFLLAVLCVMGQSRAGTMTGLVLPGLALSVPILDTLLTFVRRRIVQRRSIFSAERGHIHHRLIDMGFRHHHAVLLLYAATLAAAGLAALALYGDGLATLGGLALLVPLLVGLFRFSGSVRGRDTLKAVRRNRFLQRSRRRSERSFEEQQLSFARVTNFDEWWDQLCVAADVLGFASVTMPTPNRDGTHQTRRWQRDGAEPLDENHLLGARVPVPQRRSGTALKADVEIDAADGLEDAAHRLNLLARLVADHGLRGLDDVRRGSSPTVAPPPVGARADRERAGLAATLAGRLMGGAKSPTALSALALDPPPAGRAAAGDKPRVAIVHDFLYVYAGAERVLEQLLEVYPDADLFSLFDFLPKDGRGFIRDKPVTTSFIQKLPFARRAHRMYLPLMPIAIEQLDVSAYDVVISSSYCVAKGVITSPDQLHVCYCHSPVRFAWDQQHQYLGAAKMGWGPKSLLARAILHYIRTWDARSANGVDLFVTNSDFVGRRVEKVYRRPSVTVYPPVDVHDFEPRQEKEDFYVTASRLVPYKRIDLVVEAFNAMPDKRLIVVGDGPERERLEAMAGPNVRIVGHQPLDKLRGYLQMARAFVFAAEEDFGIVVVEAQACGTPVIAFGRGGAGESVVAGETGVFFRRQEAGAIRDAVERFEQRPGGWDAARIRKNAERFAADRFRDGIDRLVSVGWANMADAADHVEPDGDARPDGDADKTPPHNGRKHDRPAPTV